MGDLAKENPVLRQLGLSSLGRAARGHLLLTKTLLIVGQEGSTQREENVKRESGRPTGRHGGDKLRGPRPETRRLRQDDRQSRGRSGAAPQRDGAPMTYMLNGKQFIVVPTGAPICPRNSSRCACPETGGLHHFADGEHDGCPMPAAQK